MGYRRCHRCFLTPIRSDGIGIQKRESGLTAWEFRKGSGEGGCQIGEVIGQPPPLHVSFDTNPVCRPGNAEKGIRSDGLGIQKREEGWRGGSLQARGASRVPLRHETGAAPPRCQAPARFGGVHRTRTRPCEEQGGGCLTRHGPRCRGRGEAARDYVLPAEPCRTTAVDRTVAGPSPHR